MAELRLVPATYDTAPPIDRFGDATIFQTMPWLSFVREVQRGEIVVASVLDVEGRAVGRFTGITTRAFGLRMLGSPFPGWTTQYMGFNLGQGIARGDALAALSRFAFRSLGCVHFEVMDRHATLAEHDAAGLVHHSMRTFEIDLSKDEDALFGAMTSACRRCVRKADKEGVVIELADPATFADDYYAQLKDVFAKQGLAPTYPKARVEALIRNLHPTGQLLLLRARDPDGTSIATALLPAWNGTMYFWGGASWRDHQQLRPNEALIWYAMRYWKARGAVRFDMGGGGQYKSKYGGRELFVPWGHRSVTPALEWMRNAARTVVRARQRLAGAGSR